VNRSKGMVHLFLAKEQSHMVGFYQNINKNDFRIPSL